MTKTQAVAEFQQHVLPHVLPDGAARRQAWNDFTDALCKAGRITSHQYNTWLSPACVKRRENKYDYLFVLQGRYGHGWEDLSASESMAEIRRTRREYRDNEGGEYRVIQRRDGRSTL
jgi:hypothetical protein